MSRNGLRRWFAAARGTAAALLGLMGIAAPAQRHQPPPPGYLELSRPDKAEGRKILEEFRQQGISGDYFLEFKLDVLPRQGPEWTLQGRMWGSRNAEGPVTRIDIQPRQTGQPEVRLLVQNGRTPAMWRWTSGSSGPPERLGVEASFTPIEGTVVTPFDLQQPFLYWTDFDYEGLVRMHGRPTYQFLLRPPAELAARHPELTGVRVYLDTQYDALVQAELIGKDGTPLKSFSLLDLKKIDDQWLVKAVDVRNERTRDKTRFVITSAALRQHFPRSLFTPADLPQTAPLPLTLDSLDAP